MSFSVDRGRLCAAGVVAARVRAAPMIIVFWLIAYLVLDFAWVCALWGLSLLTGAWPWFIPVAILGLAVSFGSLVWKTERYL